MSLNGHCPYRAFSAGICPQFVGPAFDDACIVDEDFLLAVDLPSGNVQRWITIKLGRNYLVQLL